ncbi:hypothetical protein PHYSODRAFT_247425 [Phytophthora sojae]|uniref:Uncharacterized protein n=1 Tax=Phytophthora sojae (strain P6497) TaxID=1094619 RepID=G4Z684_PHYSP|nr:hypothetical protein PHYSODRAFT_247425 [Phytophthora sojae]EGZ21699.1 hypothetical protein PHYSODRAFT_247425 [Phytophthora sojae]|eukprot:XP_009524416.1 hypothetical protein PHYSODRAFT_247425 [Phytophthora sojae]
MSKRPKHSSGSQDPDADEASTKALQELEEASLTAQAAVDADAIGVAERHVEAVKLELSRAKSAESLLNSIVAAPHAWQLALQASEVVDQFEDFISLHALNRQLLRLPNASSKSFTARLATVDQFHSGSRSQLIASITAAAGSSEEGRIGWLHARCVSLFELLLILMATHTFRDDSWLAIFATSSPSFLKRKGLRLLAEATLRDLIHSSYGVTVVTESLLRLPGLATLLELSGLQASADTVWMDLTLSEVNPAAADQDMGPDRS